eukprot:Colp12_sorted_trinity150504_noHs@13188
MFLKLSLLIVVLALFSKESYGAAPTKSPTFKPTTSSPTRKPSAKPTPMPSFKPSLTPTMKPSTAAPTEKPTFVPTPAPSAKPTFIPSAIPTAPPTAIPTENPTASPTEIPTLIPTAAPTEIPTLNPTETPTADPTFSPTDLPSAEPTVPPPSASPTIRPTANPTLTFAPTVSPTRQMNPVVSWVTNITLDGVGAPQLDTDCQRTVMITTAEFLNLPTDALSYLGSGPATLVSGRRLQGGKMYTYLVSMKVSINIARTNYATAFQLYNASALPLENAVHHGDFDRAIQTNAVTYGTPDLLRASSYQISDSPYAVAEPDFSKDEDLGLTEGGVAIIVICCLVMFFVILYMAWNSTQKHAPPPGVEHASPNGYAIAEDEENTTINKL